MSRPEFADIDLEIVDVLDRPELAEKCGVARTPTIVSMDDTRLRMVGDLSAVAEILRFLRD